MRDSIRKRDRRMSRADLLTEPRDWLDEISGTIEIMNRCDVRVGVDTHAEDVRVLNGIRRSEEMDPLLFRPVYDSSDAPNGFELVTPDALTVLAALTNTQTKHWQNLPEEFRFEEVANKLVPRASLKRLIDRTTLMGSLRRIDGVYKKVMA